MDGLVLGKEENPYTGKDYGTYDCGNIGEDFYWRCLCITIGTVGHVLVINW